MSREFESHGRKLQGEKVDLPAGVRARDLETGRDVTGPAVIWRSVGAPPPGVQGLAVNQARATEEEAAEEPVKKRGRPPGSGKTKGGEAPPDL